MVRCEAREKLKASVTNFYKIDDETKSMAESWFSNALYGKFLGRAPPLDTVKNSLLERWSVWGETSIADLPNGYFLIRCSSQIALHNILFEGPWTINGLVLQLLPWHPLFQPVSVSFNTAATWLQLHHLPVELWEGEILESLVSNFGRLLKINEQTLNLSLAKYVRVCVELDLSQPLRRGFWIGDEEHRVFVVVQYERLPTFCYNCRLIGHEKLCVLDGPTPRKEIIR